MLFVLISQAGFAKIQQTVNGTVVDDSGIPLPGVTVQVEGTARGVTTNMDGNFSIEASSGEVLLLSFLGYNSQEIVVDGEEDLEIILTENIGELNEVVVVGYGQQQKVDLIAPIQVVDDEELKRIPTASPTEALQGLVSGVTVSNNGAPGATPSIQIRGLGSVRGDFSPLYVVDGVVTKDIGFLDMNSIESMSVLKDASSAAIYGVRAANGVIIIETKRGKKGKPSISYEGYAGIQKVTPGNFSLLNNEDYIDFTNNKLEANAARNNSTFTPFDPNDYPDNTNWFDEILRTAFTQKHSLNISGGSENNRYFVGLNYFEQEGVVKKNSYERVNVRITDDIDFSDYFRAGISTDMSITKIDHLAGGLLGQAYRNPPVYSPRNEDGEFTNPDNLGLGQYANPAATLDRWNNVEPFTTRNISNIYFELMPIEGLTLKTSFSADISNYSTRNYARAWNVSIIQTDDSNALTRQYGRQFNYVWDNTITYKQEIDKHRFTVLAGSAYTSYFSQFLNGFNTGVEYFSDASLYLVNGDETTEQQASDGGSKRVNQSYFGRLSYTFDDKYMLNATLRTDGSSSFPENNRWGTFPSLGLGWVASEESFFNESEILDYLKIRASYGMLGNSDIPQGTYILPVDNRPYLSAVFGPYDSTNISQGATITTAVQPDLTWEVVEEYNFGFDSNWFDNQLSIEMDYFYRTTRDAIFPVILSATSGVSTPSGGNDRAYLDNNANILNSGLEFLTSWNKQVNEDFTYNISANATFQKNEISELQTGTIALYNGYRSSSISQVGRPVGEFYVYEVEGIFQDQAEVNNYVDEDGDLIMPNAVPGDFKYADNNGDGRLDDQDKISAGNYLPSFLYGINFNMEYKNIDFSIQGQGVEGVSVFNVKRIDRSGNQNIDQDFYDNMWRGPGTSNTYPAGDVLGGRNPDPNSFNVESGDYFRIRNITLGYTFSENSFFGNALSRFRIYASATNPVTFHRYNGFTPEISGGNPTNRGYDNGVYPISATYLVGLNINL
ncbi:SusC/RagA family TonB-linked outer membrane protein [Salegentibacter sp. T436]|uniref:SusC/RagA family TonB-linked outer membrane protein n=1 Tax=Salegentibacter sp. T436 TaxID=1729720 RepID=UPI0018DB8B16|nr:TonB-dependent receptor [Salegentibacter sp. T436]